MMITNLYQSSSTKAVDAERPPPRFYITATDTDAGKTVCAAVLAAALDADYWKPVQTGVPAGSDSLGFSSPQDRVRVQALSPSTIIHNECYVLRDPLSPHAAAANEGISFDLQKLRRAPSTERPLIIEGAGGVLVPLTEDTLLIDLVPQWNASVIFISNTKLGSINHTLLSIEALRNRGIDIKGILFNGKKDSASEDFICTFSKVPCLGRVEPMEAINSKAIQQQAERLKPRLRELLFTDTASTQSWSTRDAHVVWHPYTQMKTAPLPRTVVRGKGARLYDESGYTLIDGISSWWVNLHGHAHPAIAEAIATQARTLEHVIFAGFTHPPAVRFAERLIEQLPSSQKRVFFSDNGSTAVEVALKMAIQHGSHTKTHAPRRILALTHSYHGDTFGAMSVSARGLFTLAFQDYLFEVDFVDCSAEEFQKKLCSDVAAFIFEPLIQGAGGMRMHDPAVLSEMISMAQKQGVITIADEVMTGFGRTHTLFASQQLSAQPDIMCLSKGITGGFLPLGVTTCTEPIYQSFYSDDRRKTFFHGHSYTASPLACAAANASLDLLLNEATTRARKRITESHLVFLQTLKKNPRVLNPRCQGTVLAFEITSEQGDYLDAIGPKLFSFYLDHGVLLRPLGNTVYVMPPYCISDDDLQTIYKVILKSLAL